MYSWINLSLTRNGIKNHSTVDDMKISSLLYNISIYPRFAESYFRKYIMLKFKLKNSVYGYSFCIIQNTFSYESSLFEIYMFI